MPEQSSRFPRSDGSRWRAPSHLRRTGAAAAALTIVALGAAGCGSDNSGNSVSNAINSVKSQAQSIGSQVSTAVTQAQQQAQSVQSQAQSVQSQVQKKSGGSGGY